MIIDYRRQESGGVRRREDARRCDRSVWSSSVNLQPEERVETHIKSVAHTHRNTDVDFQNNLSW